MDGSLTGDPTSGGDRLTDFAASRSKDDAGFVHEFSASAMIGRFSYNGLLTLNSLLMSGDAKIRVDTALVTQNGQQAELQFGREQFFTTETGTVPFPRIDLERIESGVTVTPQVAQNGDITLDLKPTVIDAVAIGPDGLPILQKRTVQSRVRVTDGETVVIAGLVKERQNKHVRKVPLLGSVPIIDHLFRSTVSVSSRREVAIFITPRLLGGGEALSPRGLTSR